VLGASYQSTDDVTPRPLIQYDATMNGGRDYASGHRQLGSLRSSRVRHGLV